MKQLAATTAALLLLPLAVSCGARETAVVGAGAAAAAAIVYDDRGANTKITPDVNTTVTATEAAFRDLGITLTERKTEEDGIELKGAQDDWKIVVDIERDPGDALTEVEVTVSKDQVNYDKDRAERILRAILDRAR